MEFSNITILTITPTEVPLTLLRMTKLNVMKISAISSTEE